MSLIVDTFLFVYIQQVVLISLRSNDFNQEFVSLTSVLTIFFFPPLIRCSLRSRLCLCSAKFLYRMGSAYCLHRRTCYTKKEPPRRISEVLESGGYLLSHNIPQCSTIGDAVSLPCALSLLPSPLSALSRARAPRRAHRRPPRASDAFFSTQRPPLTHDYIKSMVSLFNTVFVLLTSFLLVSL